MFAGVGLLLNLLKVEWF